MDVRKELGNAKEHPRRDQRLNSDQEEDEKWCAGEELGEDG